MGMDCARWNLSGAKRNGAGEGNRTLVASLEGWSFTIKLHPLGCGEVNDAESVGGCQYQESGLRGQDGERKGGLSRAGGGGYAAWRA